MAADLESCDASSCRFRETAPDHHDRLVRLEVSTFEVVTELIELAATWHELEYCECAPLVPPDEWIPFIESHRWSDFERVFDMVIGLVSLAPRRAEEPELRLISHLADYRSAVS